MTFPLEDANTLPHAVATEPTGAGEDAFVHVVAFDVAGVATLVSSSYPLPIVNLGSVGISGDTVITSATVAQTLFSGNTPVHGYLISNNTAQPLFVSDLGA